MNAAPDRKNRNVEWAASKLKVLQWNIGTGNIWHMGRYENKKMCWNYENLEAEDITLVDVLAVWAAWWRNTDRVTSKLQNWQNYFLLASFFRYFQHEGESKNLDATWSKHTLWYLASQYQSSFQRLSNRINMWCTRQKWNHVTHIKSSHVKVSGQSSEGGR